jgi:hypothetical protein
MQNGYGSKLKTLAASPLAAAEDAAVKKKAAEVSTGKYRGHGGIKNTFLSRGTGIRARRPSNASPGALAKRARSRDLLDR